MDRILWSGDGGGGEEKGRGCLVWGRGSRYLGL